MFSLCLCQVRFGVSFLQMISSNGHLLDVHESIEDAKLYDGDTVTVILQEAQLAATGDAFAFYGRDRVVTWGSESSGGDSSEAQELLTDVREIKATSTAFAAILADGHVVTWGLEDYGGDSGQVLEQLKDVKMIAATGASSDPPPPRGGPGPFLTRKGAKFRGSTLLGE